MTTHRRRLIADALGRSPETILEIDAGYDFEVAIVDDEWVFRFPRRAGVEEALEVEIVLLPALAPALPVDVPSLEHISRDPLLVGYRLIRGEPLVDEDADGVRAFVEALHALDPTGLPVERPVWVEARPSSTSSRCSCTPTSVRSISSCATAVSPASSTGVMHDWAILLSTTPGCSTPPSRTGTSTPTSVAGSVLPPSRTVVRSPLWRVHEPAGAREARSSRDQRQALSFSVPGDALIDPPPDARFAYCV